MPLNRDYQICIVFLSYAVIGDEILKGLVKDTNSTFLCKQLWDLGIRVERVGAVFVCVRFGTSLLNLSLVVFVIR